MTYFNVILNGFSVAFNSMAGLAWLRPVSLLLLVVIVYAVGSLNFYHVFARCKFHCDLNEIGNGYADFDNMMMNFGRKYAFLSLMLELVKGVLIAAIGLCIWGVIGGYLAVLFGMVGFAFPLYYRFQGGKGIGAVAGGILLLNSTAFLIILSVYLVLVLVSKLMSLGTIISVAIYPLIAMKTGVLHGIIIGIRNSGYLNYTCIMICLILMIFVIILHRKNLINLWKGKEPKVYARDISDNNE